MNDRLGGGKGLDMVRLDGGWIEDVLDQAVKDSEEWDRLEAEIRNR